jgi:hypothetical protein
MNAGDEIIYKIYGGTYSTPVGGIRGINYVKLSSGGGTGYDLQFTSLNDMNESRFGFGYTFDGNNFYSACGETKEYPHTSTTIERYNIANNAWTVFATGLIPRMFCSAEYVPSQNSIYVFNGDTYTSNTYTDTIEIINVNTGGITYNTSNPYPVEYCGSAVWNNKIYIFGGSNSGEFSDRLYEFDPAINNWTRLTDMPEAKQTNGEIVDGILYVFGGYNGSVSKRIDAYNIQNSTWTPLGELPTGISAHSTTTSGKYIWIVGSYDNINYLSVFNTETNEITELNTNMIGRRHCGVCVEGDKLFVYGGNQESSYASVLNSLQVADISGYTHSINEYNGGQQIGCNIFPNPFSGITNISYPLEEFATAQIRIFNSKGQLVESIEMEQPQGEQMVQWSAEGLPGGIYYLRIQAGNKAGRGKMVIISD